MKTSPDQMTPQTRRWRTGLLTACGLALVVNIFSLLECSPLTHWCGTAGFEGNPNIFSGWVEITSVQENGPAARAGMRAGDRIDMYRETDFKQRLWLDHLVEGAFVPRDADLQYTVHRGNHALQLLVKPQDIATNWSTWFAWLTWPNLIAFIAALWGILFAALLASRRADLVQARLLSLILLALFGFGTGLAVPWWPRLDLILGALSGPIPILAPLVLFALFAATFARPLSLTRRILTGIVWAAAILGVLQNVAFGIWWQALGLPNYPRWIAAGFDPTLSLGMLAALACGVAAAIASSGADRQRAAWATASMAPYWLFGVLSFIVTPWTISKTGFSSEAFFTVQDLIANVVSITMPVGLTYSILSRRIIDVGYVINQSAIFTTISVFILSVFVLVEWALGTWIGNASHTTSIVVNVIVALILGLSIRPIHRRAEHVVDRVFFRKRHEHETALRRFAHEASFITDSETLLDRTVAEVKQHADLAHVGVLVTNGKGMFELTRGDITSKVISENDPALLTMRASHGPVDLQQYQTAIDGDRAYPLVARGAILGVLVCGSRSSHEPYAPDEADALDRLAQGVGIALDSLRTGHPDGEGAIMSRLETVQQTLQLMSSRID